MPWMYIYPDGFRNTHIVAPRMVAMLQTGGFLRAEKLEEEIAAQIANGWPEEATRKFLTALVEGGLTEEEATQTLLERDMPTEATGFKWVANHAKDRHFREAWTEVDGVIDVDMPKARGVHMDNIRKERNKKLTALDLDFLRAIEAGDTSEQDRVAGEKQVLRDIPQTFDLSGATTPEELKALWPSELE
jgi:hypothetical protein